MSAPFGNTVCHKRDINTLTHKHTPIYFFMTHILCHCMSDCAILWYACNHMYLHIRTYPYTHNVQNVLHTSTIHNSPIQPHAYYSQRKYSVRSTPVFFGRLINLVIIKYHEIWRNTRTSCVVVLLPYSNFIPTWWRCQRRREMKIK